MLPRLADENRTLDAVLPYKPAGQNPLWALWWTAQPLGDVVHSLSATTRARCPVMPPQKEAGSKGRQTTWSPGWPGFRLAAYGLQPKSRILVRRLRLAVLARLADELRARPSLGQAVSSAG